MRGRPMTDREAYPAAWITLAALAGAFLLWRFALEEPTVSRCWIWEHWHVYCPGCGGTRALIALARGQIGEALRCHLPAGNLIMLFCNLISRRTVHRADSFYIRL